MNAIILKLITHLITLNNWCQYCYSLVGLPNLNKSKRLLLLQHLIIVLSSTRIFAISYGRLTKSSDEMSTKNSRILVLVFVL